MATRSKDDKEESPLIVLAVLGGALLVIGVLIWLINSNKIVYGSLQPMLWLGAMWKMFPSDFTYSQWNHVAASTISFARNPADVDFFTWISVLNTAIRPLSVVVCLAFIGITISMGFRSRQDLCRRLTADQLMGQSVEHFTGIAPVIGIRKQIATDQHPLWRRQVAPEEVFLKYKVPRTKAPSSGSLAKTGAHMMREGAFDREVARAYFIGAQEILPDGRMVSSMLGRQIVNLSVDARKAKSTVFSDRMSSEGKALFSLWAAVAFGGVEGRDEYCDFRDRLNRSAYMTKDGIANLSLAQPLYEKYRKHPLVNKLFAIHHWEHTFLFSLLAMAQKRGRYTTADVLWLRPLNRVMYASMNTRGAYTPHTESATTFSQQAYEIYVAKLGRLPLLRDAEGGLVHVIFVNKAVEGLELEALRWVDAIDDEDDGWWSKKDVWTLADQSIKAAELAVLAAVPTAPPPGALGETADTPFDLLARSQAEQQERDDEAVRQKLSAFSSDPGFMDILNGADGSSKKDFK